MERFGLKLVKQFDFYRPGTIDNSLNREQIIHELSHFQIASPSKRLVVNFGLGEDTQGTNSILSEKEQIQEETRAFLLTLYRFDNWNIPIKYSGFRFKGEFHYVTKTPGEQNQETRKAYDWLLVANILDHNLKPTTKLNKKENI